jgi:dihydrofolate synthase/folylpolyglutamate synthase
MNYSEALAYLDNFVNLERNLNRSARSLITLEPVQELATRLGNPQNNFKSIHIAGTKGKGSTCAFAAAILAAAGLKAGLYISPHLQDVRERISINGGQIPPADLVRLLQACEPVLEEMRHPPKGKRRPTYFEVLTHLAFAWFAEHQVDVAVIEVGLGGRLDATNIIKPLACGITSISFDHTLILGNTLPQIAADKAGIMKPGTPVVSAPQKPEVMATLSQCAGQAGVPLEFVGRELKLETLNGRSASGETGCWPPPSATLHLPDGPAYAATLGLRGSHQAENWAVALRLADLFFQQTKGRHIPAAAVAAGSRNIRWPGRLEVVNESATPLVFLDGAHNDFSLLTVLNEIRRHLPARPLTVLFACAKDKDFLAMLKVLLHSEINHVVFTHSGNVRAKKPEELAAEWQKLSGHSAPAQVSSAEAFQTARQLAWPDGVLLVTGSLYLVGAIKTLVQNDAGI